MTTTEALKRRYQKLTDTTQRQNGKPIIITKIIPGCKDEADLRKLIPERDEPNIIRRYIIGVDEGGHLL